MKWSGLHQWYSNVLFFLLGREKSRSDTFKNDALCLRSPVLREKLEIFCTHTHPDVPMIAGNSHVNRHAEFRCLENCSLPDTDLDSMNALVYVHVIVAELACETPANTLC